MLTMILLAASIACFLPTIANGYSFYITNTPQQCQNLSLAITGFGTPPYSATIVPTGASPLPNGIEVREVLNQNFTGGSTTLDAILPWPQNSQFVVVVSDALGFGTGGTSVPITVQNSSDSSCFNASKEASPPSFTFSIQGDIEQCNNIRFSMDGPTQGNLQFQGVIPGGQSFQMEQAANPYSFHRLEGSLAFNWTVTVRGGSEFIIVGGDGVGIGSGGHSGIEGVAASGYKSNNTCINSLSPSSTAGSPAGGSPTGTSTPSPPRSAIKTGAVVGGAVGGFVGLAALALILFAFRRSKRNHEEHVDLFHGYAPTGAVPSSVGSRGDLFQNYQVEPFVGPDPTFRSSSYGYGSDSDIRASTGTSTTTDLLQSGTRGSFSYGAPGGSPSKHPAGPVYLRPVNIVEHADAGPGERSETVELPPAYTNIRRQLASQHSAIPEDS